MNRPEYTTDEHLEYLDGLRKLGATNTFGIRSLLMRKFPNLTDDEGAKILMYWDAESFSSMKYLSHIWHIMKTKMMNKKIIKFLCS